MSGIMAWATRCAVIHGAVGQGRCRVVTQRARDWIVATLRSLAAKAQAVSSRNYLIHGTCGRSALNSSSGSFTFLAR